LVSGEFNFDNELNKPQMASLFPGYKYDIFISYRQKDNKHDGWVTEFVNNLKGELESTFKEEISVYFDINPHDGLLETHDVDESLKEKLKCLVFIPIISRTYCDPKSFAWEHEFKAFVDLASQDQFGLKVKLPNGNVATRILPMQIHDLYPEDKTIIEKELGGVLRSIEFIYKEPGVNRPLTSGDDKEINLNKTKYHNQINKVAIAIEEVIHGLRSIQTAPAERNLKIDHHAPISREGSEKKEQKRELVSNRNFKKWLLSGLLGILSIASVFGILHIIEKRKQSEDIANLEKSIAVLPFVNDSPDKENEYFCNGMMDEILNNLQKIKDFRVLSRTSVEQYRGTSKPTIPKIAKALDVNYIVEGSVQKYGNTFRLRVQLIAANNEKHLWGESYEQKIESVEDIFRIQNQIAQTISNELKVIITPEEKQLIEKTPTGNLTAYDLYLKASDYQKDYRETRNISSYQTAVNLYKTSIEIDSAFARAYSGLARIYYDRYYWESYFKESFLDSCLVLTNIALSFYNKLDEAYYIKGQYYQSSGHIKEALDNYDKALQFNPNYFMAYSSKGYLLTSVIKDYVKGIDNLQKALTLISGNEQPALLRTLGYRYMEVGFIDKAKEYYQEAFALDGNKATYFNNLAWMEFALENFDEALNLAKKAYEIDTSSIINLMYYEVVSGHNDEAYIQAQKQDKYYKTSGVLNLQASHRIGYFFWKAGQNEDVRNYFNQQIKYCEESIKLNRNIAQWGAAQYDMAMSYAFLGDKVKAYQYLDEIDKLNFYPLWWVSYAKHNPFMISISNEEQYQKLLHNMETKYQAEHERVTKWWEENNML